MLSSNTSKTPWVLPLRPNPKALLQLFCFPYAGGNPSIFRIWPGGLPADIEVCAVQLPGHGGRLREPPFTNLEALVGILSQGLTSQFDRPFAFFGHSMGAIIAFELARALEKEVQSRLLHLFVSGRQAPQFPDVELPSYNLPEPQFIEKLRLLNGTPREVFDQPELMQIMIPVLRADFELVQTYRFSPSLPLGCPITAFGGLEDTDVTEESLRGWREHTTASFRSRMFEGDHFFLQTAQPALLRALSIELHQLLNVIV